MFVCLCVRMSIFLEVSVECACASFCASNCSLSAGGKYSSHFSSADALLGTSHTALAFSLSFPHSFFNLPLLGSRSGNRALEEVQPPKKKKKKKGVFNLSPPWPLLPFFLQPHINCTCRPVFKCGETGLRQRKLMMWRLPSWWSVYRMNKKDNLCSQSGKIAQMEPPTTKNWPIYQTLITEVHQHSSSPGAPAATHERGHLCA